MFLSKILNYFLESVILFLNQKSVTKSSASFNFAQKLRVIRFNLIGL